MSDIIIRHRLFWSYFILGTEKWLGGMSSSGFNLLDLDFNGNFKFKQGEPHNYNYTFSYVKFEPSQKLNTSSKIRGWEQIGRHEKWSLYRAEKKGATGQMPNRRGLFLRNNSLLCLYALLSSITLLLFFGAAFGIFAYISRDSGSSDIFFRQSMGIIGLFALLLLGNFVLFLRLTSVNNRILEEPDAAAVHENAYRQYLSRKTFEAWLEKLLIRDGDIVKRLRPLWILYPRRFENRLSRMELKGLNVYKVHRTGLLFYFIKSSPRKMRYCILSGEGADIPRYLAQGWRVIHSSTERFWLPGRITLLAVSYEDKPPLPFKNEREYFGNALRIMLRGMTLLFVLLIFPLAVFFTLFCFKVCIIGIWIAAAISAVIMFLILIMLLDFLLNVKFSRKLGDF